MTNFHTTHYITARKDHRCEGCSQCIEPGEAYVKIVGYEDGFYSGKLHAQCHELRKALFDDLEAYEGLPWSAAESLMDLSEGQEHAQEILDMYRGRLPHAVTRTELRLRNWLKD